jgi:hypothetical protein
MKKLVLLSFTPTHAVHSAPENSCQCAYMLIHSSKSHFYSSGVADSLHTSRPQPFQPKLHMTDEDFLSITHNGRLCDAEGGLGLKEFELVMRNQVHLLYPHARFEPCSKSRW